jgi:hypothetical protein
MKKNVWRMRPGNAKGIKPKKEVWGRRPVKLKE